LQERGATFELPKTDVFEVATKSVTFWTFLLSGLPEANEDLAGFSGDTQCADFGRSLKPKPIFVFLKFKLVREPPPMNSSGGSL
jgi:hypothetical protein